jgi:pyruvate dehydrogenase E2 component (dihydrolipoamide acetyltransferase)
LPHGGIKSFQVCSWSAGWRQPLVVEGTIVARAQITLSLTFDHRAVDGAPAARFLQSLCKAVENPAPYLID